MEIHWLYSKKAKPGDVRLQCNSFPETEVFNWSAQKLGSNGKWRETKTTPEIEVKIGGIESDWKS